MGAREPDQLTAAFTATTQQLRATGIRVQVDHGNDRTPKKTRTHTKAKAPFQLIAGEDDRGYRHRRRRTSLRARPLPG
jgi:threonyl-tRNA synthetase